MAHHGMRDVILVDDGDPGPGERASRARGDPQRAHRGAPPAAPSDGDVRPTPGHRHLPLVGAVALAVALVGVLVGDGVADRRRAARLAELPGVLEPMSASLEVLWSRPGGWQHPAVHGPDLIVSLFEDPGRRFRLVADDPVTGEERWDVTVPDLQFWGDLTCHALGGDTTGAATTHVVCRRVERAEPEGALPAYGPRVQASLMVLDAHTGETVADRVLDYGFGVVEPFGSDVLVTTVLADGRVLLAREDLLTGRARWAVVSEPYPGEVGLTGPQVEPQNGYIVVDGPFGMVVSADGQVLGEWPAPEGALTGPGDPRVDVTVLADGRFVVGSSDLRLDVPYGAVLRADGSQQFPVEGTLIVPTVDDGSAAELLLTAPKRSGGIAALDARTGRPVWTAEATPRGESLLLEDRLITTSGSRLIAVDTRSGRRLWTSDHSPGDHALLTDGRVLLVPYVAGDGASTLTALDLTDGRVLWTASGPPDVVAFLPIGGRLIALQQERMMRVGPASTDA